MSSTMIIKMFTGYSYVGMFMAAREAERQLAAYQTDHPYQIARQIAVTATSLQVTGQDVPDGEDFSHNCVVGVMFEDTWTSEVEK